MFLLTLSPSFPPSILLPSSCAIGEAVLDIIKYEKLQENALKTGAYLKQQLEEKLLLQFPSVIGDVRGLGLFLGVECIEGREEEEEEVLLPSLPQKGASAATKEEEEEENEEEDKAPIPSREAAEWIVARARERGVQLSVDGPQENVLKIKPPLCFGKEEADLLVRTLEKAVGEYVGLRKGGRKGGRKG